MSDSADSKDMHGSHLDLTGNGSSSGDRDGEQKDSRRSSKERSSRKDKDRRSPSRSRSSSRSRRRRHRSRSRSGSRDRRKRSRERRHRSRSRSRSRKRSRRSRSRSRDRRRRSPSRSRSRSRSRSPRRKSSSSSSGGSSSSKGKPAFKQLDETTVVSSSGITMPSPAVIQKLLAARGGDGEGSMPRVDPEQTNKARRLYIGNLPVGLALTEGQLVEYFSNLTASVGIQTQHPVKSVWVSSDHTFCFCEFRSVADTTACLSLFQGVTLGGRPLRVGRPADYVAAPPHLINYVAPITPQQLQKIPPPPPPGQASTNPLLAMSNMGGGLGSLGMVNVSPAMLTPGFAGPVLPPAPVVVPPSRVLLLKNMLTPQELMDDDEYVDIVADVREECEKHGKIVRIIIPRPMSTTKSGPTEEEQKAADAQAVDVDANAGKIFVVYEAIESCTAAVKALNGRTFNQKIVLATYFDETQVPTRKEWTHECA